MNESEVYITLFTSSFLSSTILPGHSELTLTVFIFLNKLPVTNLVLVASLGNILGSILNWYLGFNFTKLKEKKWFPLNETKLQKSIIWFSSYGKYCLLLSWVPILGDPLTLVAGILRIRLFTFIIFVSIAKVSRYVIIALISKSFLF
jgi:membrane protein YqaA with SNARE-associated domain